MAKGLMDNDTEVNPQMLPYFDATQAYQKENESLDAFRTRLKNLAISCEFFELQNVIIDQVIAHCTSQELRKKLLQDRDLTLEKIQAYTQKQQDKPKCYRCGKTDHLAYEVKKCPVTGQTCQNCRNMGHFATACRFPKQYAKKINATVYTIGQEDNAENFHDN
ncbi:uncharacterized protein [Palaemon carinicauda]|uniref:uncharacterized protein n=1 Tax=Palaemon carinicauda TaxID=392227 RepID=UPI0035B626CB